MVEIVGVNLCLPNEDFGKRNSALDVSFPLWRTKKSHFQASVEMGMKNVDKDAVNTTIGLLCYLDA